MNPVPQRDPLPHDELLIFVYGTMLRGEANHTLMTGARFLRKARTRAEFDLHDLGGFPGMVAGGRTQVKGELFAVTQEGVHNFDELEDHPEYFRRTEVLLDDGARVETYLLDKALGAPYPRITGGSWCNREGRRQID
jgi:gamma-glutamylaminecyclotransferase